MRYEIRKLEEKDLIFFQDLVNLFIRVFETNHKPSADNEQLLSLLKDEKFFAIAAFDKGRIIGGLSVYKLDQYYSSRPLAYIYDLAVLDEYQRQGIGAALINFTRSFCRDAGYEALFVQAEKADAGALDFYRATEATEQEVVHFTYDL